jgi:hypothetical protein
MSRVPLFAVLILSLSGLAACGEKEQVVVYKQGKYQGKPDSKPWDNEPLAYGGTKWTKGDEKSWEAQIKARQLGQHEDKRIYQQ